MTARLSILLLSAALGLGASTIRAERPSLAMLPAPSRNAREADMLEQASWEILAGCPECIYHPPASRAANRRNPVDETSDLSGARLGMALNLLQDGLNDPGADAPAHLSLIVPAARADRKLASADRGTAAAADAPRVEEEGILPEFAEEPAGSGIETTLGSGQQDEEKPQAPALTTSEPNRSADRFPPSNGARLPSEHFVGRIQPLLPTNLERVARRESHTSGHETPEPGAPKQAEPYRFLCSAGVVGDETPAYDDLHCADLLDDCSWEDDRDSATDEGPRQLAPRAETLSPSRYDVERLLADHASAVPSDGGDDRFVDSCYPYEDYCCTGCGRANCICGLEGATAWAPAEQRVRVLDAPFLAAWSSSYLTPFLRSVSRQVAVVGGEMLEAGRSLLGTADSLNEKGLSSLVRLASSAAERPSSASTEGDARLRRAARQADSAAYRGL